MTGSHTVDSDSERSVFESAVLSQHLKASLGHAVGSEALLRYVAHHAAHIDDAASGFLEIREEQVRKVERKP